jgi:GNAT superfamily N-acetyltransferase
VRIARFDEIGPSKEQRNRFDCGEPSLNRWLASQARQSMESRDAVTYLLIDDAPDKERIVGYYCLSSGSVTKVNIPEVMAKRAPDPIPVIRMGRFAIDRSVQGQGWGADLLREALLSAVAGATVVAARAMLVDAISEAALVFYLRHGFKVSPIHPMQAFFDLRTVAASAGIEMTNVDTNKPT